MLRPDQGHSQKTLTPTHTYHNLWAPFRDNIRLYLQHQAPKNTYSLSVAPHKALGLNKARFETLVLTHTCNAVQAPPKDSKQLFLQYAALEETYGLARSAMEVYDRAVRTVVDKERLEVYNLYLARATQFFGVGKVWLSAAEPILLSLLICRSTGQPGILVGLSLN